MWRSAPRALQAAWSDPAMARSVQRGNGGSVTGGANSVLGGFIGTLTFENGPAQNASSSATGAVTSTGSNSTVGGFAGLTSGTILTSSASGPVTGTSDSYLGGFVGVNLGSIEQSFTPPRIRHRHGNRDVIGGFVGANFGSIEPPPRPATPRGHQQRGGAFAGAKPLVNLRGVDS